MNISNLSNSKLNSNLLIIISCKPCTIFHWLFLHQSTCAIHFIFIYNIPHFQILLNIWVQILFKHYFAITWVVVSVPIISFWKWILMSYEICQPTFMLFPIYLRSDYIINISYINLYDSSSWHIDFFELIPHHSRYSTLRTYRSMTYFVLWIIYIISYQIVIYWMFFTYIRLTGVWRSVISGSRQ